METNEAPEKIYLSDFTDTTESVFYVKQDNTKKTDFEYTRTDAFIEKACEWIKEKWDNNYTMPIIIDSVIDEFKNYMKGE